MKNVAGVVETVVEETGSKGLFTPKRLAIAAAVTLAAVATVLVVKHFKKDEDDSAEEIESLVAVKAQAKPGEKK